MLICKSGDSMDDTKRIKTVIFDLGGVIYRTEDAAPRTALAERLGKTRAELEQIVFNNPVALAGERGQASKEDAWKEAARLLELPPEEIPSFYSDFFGGDRLDQQLVQFIQSLRPTFITALLSNNWSPNLEESLRETFGIVDTFDVIVSSAERGVRKPDPAIFLYALDRIGARPDEAVFVDDFETNTRAAAALGLHVVLFRSTQQAIQELRALLHLPD